MLLSQDPLSGPQTGASPREMSADDNCVVMVLMELSPVSYGVVISLAFESPDWFL